MGCPHPYTKDPKTSAILPNSENIWADYQGQYDAFRIELNRRWYNPRPDIPDI
ncbi:hypothetical protein SAMN06297358_1360 [Pedobacter xixiisoli]|uniref:Uncharacterized protein n=1 Tax=Pedobacter xixiisoli TaxID=1476464 RepID=A0A285ZWL0_9SPHI|nr:hypothetical protein SAMN06297358_1360 [Pedobacter xixiisoli]